MADHHISFTEYPHGKIRSIIADGTHWVTVSESGVNASVASKQARREILLVLKDEVEGLSSPTRIEVEESGAVVSVPVDRLVFRTAVIDIIDRLLKEF